MKTNLRKSFNLIFVIALMILALLMVNNIPSKVQKISKVEDPARLAADDVNLNDIGDGGDDDLDDYDLDLDEFEPEPEEGVISIEINGRLLDENHHYWFNDDDGGYQTYCCWTCHPAGHSGWSGYNVVQILDKYTQPQGWRTTPYSAHVTMPTLRNQSWQYTKDSSMRAWPHWAYIYTFPFPNGTSVVPGKRIGWNMKDGTDLSNSNKQCANWADQNPAAYAKITARAAILGSRIAAIREHQQQYLTESDGNNHGQSAEWGEGLYKEAKAYRAFIDALVSRDDNSATIEGGGDYHLFGNYSGEVEETSALDLGYETTTTMIKNYDNASKKDIKVYYDYNGYFILGPFKVDYVNGTSTNVTWGGISDMYMSGTNIERIPIKYFVYNYGSNAEKIVEPKYFTPIDVRFATNGATEVYQDYANRKDNRWYTSAEAGKTGAAENFPKTNQEFYVAISDEFEGKVNKLHVVFAWMRCEARVIRYFGKSYTLRAVSSIRYSGWSVMGANGGPAFEPTNLRSDAITKAMNMYNITRRAAILRVRRFYNSRVPLDGWKMQNEDYDPDCQHLSRAIGRRWLDFDYAIFDTPDIYPTVDLGGTLWEDTKTSKESVYNGIRDSEENPISGVEVYLYYADEPKKAGEPAKDTLVTKSYYFNDKDMLVERTLANPDVTDSNGKYLFENVRINRKYYIVYEYDGQTYQSTTFTGMDIQGGRNNATEVKTQRETYNGNYAEITSNPSNYKVRSELYKSVLGMSVGQANEQYIINKPSTETPYGIKEIYDFVQQKAYEVSQARYENRNKVTYTTGAYEEAYIAAIQQFSSDPKIKSKLQYIEDTRFISYSGQNTNGLNVSSYLLYNNNRALIRDEEREQYRNNIDVGLTRREIFDLALNKDVEGVRLTINGKEHKYTYDQRDVLDEDGNIIQSADETWDISVRLSDGYYDSDYSRKSTREIFGEDYTYKTSMYGDNAAAYDKKEDVYDENGRFVSAGDELNVFVTYKIMVRNQSQSVLGEVMELVDYYDEDYEFINDEQYSYIEIGKGRNARTIPVQVTEGQSRYPNDMTSINGYKALYVRGLEGTKLESGQTAYVYLTFRVLKDNIDGEKWIRLDEQIQSAEAVGVGKENIVEINGFRTYYADGTNIPNFGVVVGNDKIAGLVDIDSTPGNLNPTDVPKDGTISYANFEDDTDKAPNIRLILYREEDGTLTAREVSGIVWDDDRTENNKDQLTDTGDGKKGTKADSNEEEDKINGVTVQLVEIMANGTEHIWREFGATPADVRENTVGKGTGSGNKDQETPIINLSNLVKPYVFASEHRGQYAFKSYVPGNYIVRFKYGDTTRTVLTTDSDVTKLIGISGDNAKSYNGQDYKSTIYQTGISQSDANDVYVNNESRTFTYNITNSENANASDAKDIMSRRAQVVDYSDNDVINHVSEVLASATKVTTPGTREDVVNKLNELAQKTFMIAETGVINMEVEYDRMSTELGNEAQRTGSAYRIQNLDLGLQERPRAQLVANKKVTNVRVTLADGSTLFDATQRANNVLWREHSEHVIGILPGNRLAYANIRQQVSTANGLIQLTMDEELMHGATLRVSYEVRVTNNGEVEYKDNQFYYTGITNNVGPDNVVVSRADQLVDYIGNNLQFYANDNGAWQVIDKATVINETDSTKSLVNNALKDEVYKFNTVITTNENTSNIARTYLLPHVYAVTKENNEALSYATDDLVLTQLVTSENETDDLTYRNKFEIVRMDNEAGRRNQFSVLGNQNPSVTEVDEVDADISEVIRILPPFGNGGTPYIIAGIVLGAAVLLIIGIVIIKKVVLKKKDE